MDKLINRHVLPNTPPMDWETFLKDYPLFSIGLDGFVSTGPKTQHLWEGGPRCNMNHHEDVDRESTLATCGQALNKVRTGLLDEFNYHGNPRMELYVNDCDEDVCLSTWILENPSRAMSTSNLMLNKLVGVTNNQDMYSGLYPFPKEGPILRQMAWIYSPYRRARLNGTIDRRNPDDFDELINDVHNRIGKYIANEGKEIILDMDYEVIGGGTNWKMIREIGEHARYALLDAGIKSFISVRAREDGHYTYSYCRLSESVPFPIPHILESLNELEGLQNSPNQYGGGTTTGGSPRITGTATKPEEMIEKVNHILGEWRSQFIATASAN